VDDIHPQVSVRFGHGVRKQIATYHSKFFPVLRSDLRPHMRLIEEDSLRTRPVIQDGAQQMAASAADVDNNYKQTTWFPEDGFRVADYTPKPRLLLERPSRFSARGIGTRTVLRRRPAHPQTQLS
jgi:hypothetical protein